jgi:hypothetical protein
VREHVFISLDANLSLSVEGNATTTLVVGETLSILCILDVIGRPTEGVTVQWYTPAPKIVENDVENR